MAEEKIKQIIKSTGIVAENVELTGEVVAGRDIIMSENTTSQIQLRFTDVSTLPFLESNYAEPIFFEQILNRLETKNLIVIGGGYDFDKNTFIRQIAAKLSKKKNLKVKEWVDRSEQYSIYSSMIEEKESSIFIFTQITPQYVKYDLVKFLKLAEQYGHYIIMSSELPIESWKLSNSEKDEFWFEISSSNIYASPLLIELLIDTLLKYKTVLSSFLSFPIGKTTTINSQYTLEELAIELKTVDRINVLDRTLQQKHEDLSEKDFYQIINQITQNNEDLIRQWFNTLSIKEKETVIALSIFDGLYDDQFFGAIEYLVANIWEKRKTQLTTIDYVDLDSLYNFFNINEIDINQKIISSRFTNQKIDFFKSIWGSHRRLLLSALPVLNSIIKNSVYKTYSNWELYGTTERINNIQNIISSTLSDIGIIHLPSVENALIELASNQSIKVQEIAAKSLARWKEYGKEDQLYETLSKWQEESRISEVIKQLFNDDNKISSDAYIRSTVALTIGYASQYDRPNELSKKLLNIFKELSDEENSFVRERFKQITLPQITRNHFIQLKENLFNLTKEADYVYPIAYGLANAYNDYPDQVKKLLEEWINYCEENTKLRTRITQRKASNRDKLLITIILVLSEIRYKDAFVFDAKYAYDLIEKLQQKEFHSPVRNWYLHFIKRQIELQSSDVKPEILSIICQLRVDFIK